MSQVALHGLERAVFGPLMRDDVDSWLNERIRLHLDASLAEVVFRSGRVTPVYGCQLSDGESIVVKVHRPGVDIAHLSAAVRAQRLLSSAGYPCPAPLQGPVTVDRLTIVMESMLIGGREGNAAEPAVRRALASSLAEQVDLLRTVPTEPLRAGAPSWASYEQGPWPTPHDPIFDFSRTPADYRWLDAFADRAAIVLNAAAAPDVVGHSDWSGGNVHFDIDDAAPLIVAAFDWDSLAARPEPVIAGMSAGSHTMGGSAAGSAPTPEQVAGFLSDYDDARGRPFISEERNAAVAAACWTLAYNARCEVSMLADETVDVGGALHTLLDNQAAYLSL